MEKENPGQKQCPTCGKWDVYRAYVEDGRMGDWCPNCKQSISLKISENIRPWAKFWARNLDFITYIYIIIIIMYVLQTIGFEPHPQTKHNPSTLLQYLFAIIFLLSLILAWILVEALFLSTWGYTPGKWLLKVKVRDANQNIISYNQAFRRTLNVFIFGYGCGIFPYTFYIAHYELTENGITYWDKKGKFVVTHGVIGIERTIIAIIIIIGSKFLL